jgi:hypothetical protein
LVPPFDDRSFLHRPHCGVLCVVLLIRVCTVVAGACPVVEAGVGWTTIATAHRSHPFEALVPTHTACRTVHRTRTVLLPLLPLLPLQAIDTTVAGSQETTVEVGRALLCLSPSLCAIVANVFFAQGAGIRLADCFF